MGSPFIKKLYNNPLIGTLIPNDLDFIKLCNTIQHYITIDPVLGESRLDTAFAIQNEGKWYKHNYIRTPYPVLFWDDIEIHCIHEESEQSCLDKFLRRLNRMRDNIKTKSYKIMGILSFSEIINDHENTQSVIDLYLSNCNNIFLGPSQYKKSENDTYLVVKEWDDIKLDRNGLHIYVFNNQQWLSQVIFDHITKYR